MSIIKNYFRSYYILIYFILFYFILGDLNQFESFLFAYIPFFFIPLILSSDFYTDLVLSDIKFFPKKEFYSIFLIIFYIFILLFLILLVLDFFIFFLLNNFSNYFYSNAIMLKLCSIITILFFIVNFFLEKFFIKNNRRQLFTNISLAIIFVTCFTFIFFIGKIQIYTKNDIFVYLSLILIISESLKTLFFFILNKNFKKFFNPNLIILKDLRLIFFIKNFFINLLVDNVFLINSFIVLSIAYVNGNFKEKNRF